MLTANELRIGNMVRDNKDRILPVLWIHREGICLEEVEDFIDGNEFVSDQQVNVPFFTAQENLFGVPLTPEILQECGYAFFEGYWHHEFIDLKEDKGLIVFTFGVTMYVSTVPSLSFLADQSPHPFLEVVEVPYLLTHKLTRDTQ